MASSLKGKNQYQKAARRPGEPRVGREEIAELLELSRSDDPNDRVVAAEFLCPCHVRKRIEEVWAALYRMLEDSDLKVRRAAWHTLADGGRPEDPTLEKILDRVLENETDRRIREQATTYTASRRERTAVKERLALYSEFSQVGKCDFCGGADLKVKKDLDTLIPVSGDQRMALICESCSDSQG